ncbi:unnamed protein product [Chilo suppressalis]|uniref:Kazal-like domain-containing protein n=1 Tax=Chilo suppressalis TaxID=168631 RepID=A0ABN8AWF9_CHISP|nr:unnamed protein product [Chilo suppressalis]
MNMYWTLFLVIEMAINAASLWVSPQSDYYDSDRPLGLYHFGSKGTHKFHPPHHDFHNPHRGHCGWGENGSKDKDGRQTKTPRPPTKSTTTSTSTSVTEKSTTPSTLMTTLSSTEMPSFDICMKRCPKTSLYSPVCGTNDVTYKNAGTLICAKSCGLDVDFKALNKCGELVIETTVTMTPPTVPTSPPVTPNLRTCIRNCPVTSEYNPVCGSDGVTYDNPGRFECARMCGVDVSIIRASRCPTDGGTSSTTTTAVPPVTPSMEVIRLCLLGCPATSEYNPVCGTNGVTYDNPGRFECAKMCGLDIQVSRRSRCEVGGDITTKSPTTITPPVTPSVTPSVTPPFTPWVTPSVTPPSSTPTGLDFTIPQDILDQIFTTTYGHLIDERYDDRRTL